MSWRQRRTPDRLQVGDEIITTAGLYGFVAGFGDSVIWLEVDDGVVVRVDRAAVDRKVGSVVASPARTRERSPEAVERRPADTADYVAGAHPRE